MSRRIALIFALLGFFTAVSAHAVLNVPLDRIIRLEFEPAEAFYLISLTDGSSIRHPALIVPIEGEKTEDATKAQWLVGTVITLNDTQKIDTFSVIVKGKEKDLAFLPPERWSVEQHEAFGGSVDVLRAKTAARGEVLRTLQAEWKLNSENIRRLREDVDVIADIERIVRVKEEAQKKSSELVNARTDAENLQRFLTSSRNAEPPRNYAQRENELTRQTAELAAAAKAAESLEAANRSKLRSAVSQKRDMVELARTTDSQTLMRELNVLRKRRMELESELEEQALE